MKKQKRDGIDTKEMDQMPTATGEPLGCSPRKQRKKRTKKKKRKATMLVVAPPQIHPDYSDMNTKRKRHMACVSCSKSHKACDSARPCGRCVAAGKADHCRDLQRTAKRRKNSLAQRKMFFHSFADDGTGEKSLLEILPTPGRGEKGEEENGLIDIEEEEEVNDEEELRKVQQQGTSSNILQGIYKEIEKLQCHNKNNKDNDNGSRNEDDDQRDRDHIDRRALPSSLLTLATTSTPSSSHLRETASIQLPPLSQSLMRTSHPSEGGGGGGRVSPSLTPPPHIRLPPPTSVSPPPSSRLPFPSLPPPPSSSSASSSSPRPISPSPTSRHLPPPPFLPPVDAIQHLPLHCWSPSSSHSRQDSLYPSYMDYHTTTHNNQNDDNNTTHRRRSIEYHPPVQLPPLIDNPSSPSDYRSLSLPGRHTPSPTLSSLDEFPFLSAFLERPEPSSHINLAELASLAGRSYLPFVIESPRVSFILLKPRIADQRLDSFQCLHASPLFVDTFFNASEDDEASLIDRVLMSDIAQRKELQDLVPLFLEKNRSYAVGDIIPVYPRLLDRANLLVESEGRIQTFYNQRGELSFFILCVDKIHRRDRKESM